MFCLPKFEVKPITKFMNLLQWEDYILRQNDINIGEERHVRKECSRKTKRFSIEDAKERENLEMDDWEDNFDIFDKDVIIRVAPAESEERLAIDDDDFLSVRGFDFKET